MTPEEPLPDWKRAWRAFARHISPRGLQALRDAIQHDDSRLIVKHTIEPLPFMSQLDWPVECACPIAYTAVEVRGGFGKAIVSQVEQDFTDLCYQADLELGGPSECRHLLNWVDEIDRSVMLAQLLPEVELALCQKETPQ